MRFQDLTGERFGHLVATRRVEGRLWEFRCDCGAKTITQNIAVKSGRTISCGCFRKKSMTSHGLSGSGTYGSWLAMKKRCLNPKSKGFHNYGGRGILFCKRWRDFSKFVKDMGERPSGRTLDRVNVNGGYSPKNCRWATISEQNSNKRKGA